MSVLRVRGDVSIINQVGSKQWDRVLRRKGVGHISGSDRNLVNVNLPGVYMVKLLEIVNK